MLISCSADRGSETLSGLFLQHNHFKQSLLSKPSPLMQVREPRETPDRKLTSESHIHLWNAFLLPPICEPSPGPTKLKYANGPLVELHVDTETDMYFPEALFVK